MYKRQVQEKINDRLLFNLPVADIFCNAGSYLALLPSLATMSLKATPGVNFGTVVAWILMGAPVFGFLPTRAARAAGLKVPKPAIVTFCLLYTSRCV